MEKEAMIYTYKKYFAAFKKEDIPSHSTTEMDVKDTVLSEIRQSQKAKYCVTPFR